jgi:hypothetical protein
LLVHRAAIAKFPRTLAAVAIVARGNKIQEAIISSLGDGVYVVHIQHNIRSLTSAILASEPISFENLKSGFVRYGPAFRHYHLNKKPLQSLAG